MKRRPKPRTKNGRILAVILESGRPITSLDIGVMVNSMERRQTDVWLDSRDVRQAIWSLKSDGFIRRSEHNAIGRAQYEIIL